MKTLLSIKNKEKFSNFLTEKGFPPKRSKRQDPAIEYIAKVGKDIIGTKTFEGLDEAIKQQYKDAIDKVEKIDDVKSKEVKRQLFDLLLANDFITQQYYDEELT